MPALPSSYRSAQEYTDDLCRFIATPLIRQITGGIHVNDALIHNAWDALPPEWTTWWSSWPDYRLAQQHLIDSIEEDGEAILEACGSLSKPLQSIPESLADWLHTMKLLALPRGQHPGPTVTLPEVLSTCMKIKKRVEISTAVAYVHDICQTKGINHIIDMGSGQGYLSISLAYLFPHIQVLAIDGSKSQVAGSKSFAASLDIPESRLRHLVRWIDGSSTLAAEVAEWANGEKCMLVGLHACGSLSEHMIRYFTMIPCLEALAVVGCCYNHIVPRSPSCSTGFPISSTLSDKNAILSPTALMTGCQAPNNWARLNVEESHGKKTSIFSKRRLHRAILEMLFFDKGIEVNVEEKQVWGAKKGDVPDFAKFARSVMDSLSINHDRVSTTDLVSYEERYRHCEGQIAILGTLTVLCSKVVESVIAMDRYWYLVEHEAADIDIVPIFNFKVSPRNLMIVASKGKAAGVVHD